MSSSLLVDSLCLRSRFLFDELDRDEERLSFWLGERERLVGVGERLKWFYLNNLIMKKVFFKKKLKVKNCAIKKYFIYPKSLINSPLG